MNRVLYVFVGTGKDDGIMAIGDTPGTIRPMVTFDPELVELYGNICRKISRETGRGIKLLKFTNPEEVVDYGGLQ